MVDIDTTHTGLSQYTQYLLKKEDRALFKLNLHYLKNREFNNLWARIPEIRKATFREGITRLEESILCALWYLAEYILEIVIEHLTFSFAQISFTNNYKKFHPWHTCMVCCFKDIENYADSSAA